MKYSVGTRVRRPQQQQLNFATCCCKRRAGGRCGTQQGQAALLSIQSQVMCQRPADPEQLLLEGYSSCRFRGVTPVHSYFHWHTRTLEVLQWQLLMPVSEEVVVREHHGGGTDAREGNTSAAQGHQSRRHWRFIIWSCTLHRRERRHQRYALPM